MFRTSRLLPGSSGSAGAGYGMDPFTAAAASQAAASNLTEAMQAKLGLGAAWCPRGPCVGWCNGVVVGW